MVTGQGIAENLRRHYPSWAVRLIVLLLLVANTINHGTDLGGKVLENDSYALGCDAQSGRYGDLVAARIVDPTKVLWVELQNAASVAGLLITTEAMIATRPEGGAGGSRPQGGMG